MTKRVLSASVALALGLTLAACGGTTGSGAAATSGATSGATPPAPTGSPVDRAAASTPPAPSDEHNTVDVMFVTMMIPHHEGAIEMSEVALTQASTQPVKDLAARIKAAQGPEIEQMRGWLAGWDTAMPMAGPTADTGHGMDHGSPATSGSASATTVDDLGMGDAMSMSEADMAALRAATGVAFDRLFLQQMIVHHQGAIAMADVEIAQGRHPQALALADAIKSGQAAEIAEMQQLLSTR